MAKANQKITLSSSRDIPFNKLVLSQSNVRRVKAGISTEELAEDIARRTLLSSITVRPVRDEAGAETGMFEIPAGGRRYRALEHLVKQKRLARTAPVPCIVRTEGLAEEDSLAENVQRAPLHPLDQFRAFQAMREKDMSEEEIAAAFFVSPSIVRQRLKLASVAPALLEAYANETMTLDQLMAFTVNSDHARQEQVWDALQRHYSKAPHEIRRRLTEGAVRASDRRAQFVGLDAYEAAGGLILRDLFQRDEGGWLQDGALLDNLATQKLEREADAIRAEGWKWVEIAIDFPYGHTHGLRRIAGEMDTLTEDEADSLFALKVEHAQLEAQYAQEDGLPEAADTRLGEIETAIEALLDRPVRFEPQALSQAGAFVSIDSAGRLRVARGYVRPEDEPAATPEDAREPGNDRGPAGIADAEQPDESGPDSEADEGLKPVSDRLLADLTAHRTLALREALANDHQTAFLAALHALVLRLFYPYGQDSCIEITPRSAPLGNHAPGLAGTAYAHSIEQRISQWAQRLPDAPEVLWDTLGTFDTASREALFAHCVAMTLNAVKDPYERRPRALAHADRLAAALDLDMVKAGWTPTADSYLGQVTKARILDAVREGKGEADAERIADLKKPDMVSAAEDLLARAGWLPEALRTPLPAPAEEPAEDLSDEKGSATSESEVQSDRKDGETDIGKPGSPADTEPVAEAALA